MSIETTYVTKASGATVPFNESKLINSLIKSGANKELATQIAGEVKKQLVPGISTRKIYRIAFGLLKKLKQPLAARYKLKQALMQLGPSGFPFELYIARLLSNNGYDVKVGEIVEGKCVTHELDIIAIADGCQYMIECKFHNRQGTICDVKIPLYIQSRFIDVLHNWTAKEKKTGIIYQPWVVTNTRFTTDAIKYGTCIGMQLIGWDFPQHNNLRHMIEKSGLYPITCLTTLTQHEKQLLLDQKLVLVSELKKANAILKKAGATDQRILNSLNEAEQLTQLM